VSGAVKQHRPQIVICCVTSTAPGIASRAAATHLHRHWKLFGLASRTELVTCALHERWLEMLPGG
jgi:hypothetical protein